MEWRPVVGFEGLYDVSSCGSVKSLSRTIGSGRYERSWGERMLTPLKHSGGYLQVSLRKNGKGYKKFIHDLVLSAFCGPRPNGMQACHKDGDKCNNRIQNLRWGSAKSNALDKVRHGTIPRGQGHYASKLTEYDVKKIRFLFGCGVPQYILCDMFSLKQGTAWEIFRGKTWRHVN